MTRATGIVSCAGAVLAVASALTVEPAARLRPFDATPLSAGRATQKPIPPSGRPDERTTLSIPTSAPWTDTGRFLRSGDRVQLRAWGNVIVGDARRRTVTPRGTGTGGGCTFVVTDPSVPADALVANLAPEMTFDGRGFFVGSGWEGTVPVRGSTAPEGQLFLGFNHGAMLCDRGGYDSWAFSNLNLGAFTVELTIWRSPS